MESLLYNERTPGVSHNFSVADNGPVDSTAPPVLAMSTIVQPAGTNFEQRHANSRSIELAPDQCQGLSRSSVSGSATNYDQSWNAPVQLSEEPVSHAAWDGVTENEQTNGSQEKEEISISPQQVR